MHNKIWPQGWLLYLIETCVVNSEAQYTAAWRRKPGTAEIQVYGWTYADYRKKYDEVWLQDWYLRLLNIYVLSGVPWYTAVWRKSTASEIQIYSWTYVDYR
jgi:hypothetical protein